MIWTLDRFGMSPTLTMETMWLQGSPSFYGKPHVQVPKQDPWTNPSFGMPRLYSLIMADFIETTSNGFDESKDPIFWICLPSLLDHTSCLCLTCIRLCIVKAWTLLLDQDVNHFSPPNVIICSVHQLNSTWCTLAVHADIAIHLSRYDRIILWGTLLIITANADMHILSLIE